MYSYDFNFNKNTVPNSNYNEKTKNTTVNVLINIVKNPNIYYKLRYIETEQLNTNCENNTKINRIKLTVNNMLKLHLDLNKRNLLDYISNYCIEQTSDNPVNCGNIKGLETKKKIIKITIQDYFIIHLKRFIKIRAKGDIGDTEIFKKIKTVIDVPIELDLESMSKIFNIPRLYLFGVILHSGGESINSGHYRSFVKDKHFGWCLFDDKRVTVYNTEGDFIKHLNKEINSGTPYVLIYSKENL